MTEQRPSVVILTNPKPHQRSLIDALARRFDVRGVAIEHDPAAARRLLKRRLTKLGFWRVLDQVLLTIIERLCFKKKNDARLLELLGEAAARPLPDNAPFPILRVRSVNDPAALTLIRQSRPDVVVVSGTSLLSKATIDAVGERPIVNLHCGITPRYRGTHGAFWAIVNGDWDNVGVTIHLIDPGIDTGGILAQGTIDVAPEDTPRALVFKQYRRGIELLVKTVERLAAGERWMIQRPDLDSRLYSSPTLTAWLRYRRRMRERHD
jgi:folate-dependent phosphoribosylglycinamide formyltransferase PurN